MARIPLCPWCHNRRYVYEDGDRNYFCARCKRIFDDDPDEGGDFFTDPTRRSEKMEQRNPIRRTGA